MLNLTPDTIVFNKGGKQLDEDIRAALKKSSDTLLFLYGLEHLDLQTVTTKTNICVAFSKFVRLSVLGDPKRKYGEAYILTALDAYRQKTRQLTKVQFATLMFPTDDAALTYKSSYTVAIRPGLGLFLVALHSSGAITLPVKFSWPMLRAGAGKDRWRFREIGSLVSSELLAFVRSLDAQSDSLSHPAFKVIGNDRRRKEWFITYGTKLLLATAWHKPEDVNINDLLAIKEAEPVLSPKDTLPLAYKALLEVLKEAFAGRVSVTAEDWASALRNKVLRLGAARGMPAGGKGNPSFLFEARSDRDLWDELLKIEPLWARPESIRALTGLPGIDVDVGGISEGWLRLEELYIEKNRRESYKAINQIFRWWNVYLFFYLPYWFARNQDNPLVYPATPTLLVKTAFVSRLLPSEREMPVTFVEFMNAQRERRKWANNSYYSMLLQLEGFFGFIERYSEEIPGCRGFTQPLSTHDYPKTTRHRGTNKQPVPRRFFGLYLEYHETLIAHLNVVMSRVLSGELDSKYLKDMAQYNFIDTFASSDFVGFVPVLFVKNKSIPLQFIPNVLDVGFRTLKDGRNVLIPHPHAIHQNLIALHTGLRHNHIQWLDRDRFDACVPDDPEEFALLYVNTDKQKSAPWTPYVSMRVIDVLRAQRQWPELIGEDGFDTVHFYNDNPSTKWPKFRPLFAYTKNGRPHDDETYLEIWRSTLCGLQGLLPEVAEFGQHSRLVRLLPPGHRADDPELEKKLRAFGERFGAGEYCPLNIATLTTPHSARSAVVTQYIQFLPTDLIGAYITGQKPGVVSYYLHLDPETVNAEQVQQAMRMRAAALRNAFEPVLTGIQGAAAYIHADDVNSRLARSMRANLEETIVSYGCVSISFSDDDTSGIDVLRETRGANVAANKTELCPYGNNCPPEVVKKLRGMHRCSLCNLAVRCIDHLPAVKARRQQVAEIVDALEARLATDEETLNAKYSSEELDRLEQERGRLCEELAGWILIEEVLELTKQRIELGQDDRKWVVQKPEIIERDLQRVLVPTSLTEYVLARLGECIAYPSLESPQIRARFDLLRRELLARAGNLRAAFASEFPVDPASECAGLLKSIIASTGLDTVGLAEFLDSDAHLQNLPKASRRLLVDEGDVR